MLRFRSYYSPNSCFFKAIRIDNLVRLSRILEVSTDYILTGKQTEDDASATLAQLTALPERERKMIDLLICYCASENA